MKASVTLEEGRWTGEQTAQSTPADDQDATYGGLTLTLRVPHTQFRFDVDPCASQRTVSSREWAELKVASSGPLSFDGFGQVIKAMADLMTLCAHAPSGALKRTLRFTGTPEHPAPAGRGGEAEVMGRQVHQPLDSGSAARVEFLFTLADADFAVVVPAWLALYERASTPCGVLFGLKYISQGYASTRLLSAASSAEALHQSLHDSTPYPEDEFPELLKKVLSVFPGERREVEVSTQVHPGTPEQPHDLPGPRPSPRSHTGPGSSGLTDPRCRDMGRIAEKRTQQRSARRQGTGGR
jgi:hypothetical protein